MLSVFSVMQENLVWAIQTLAKVIDTRPKMEILGNIYFHAEGSRITMQATNLENVMTVSISGKVNVPIKFTLPATTLLNLIPMLSKERIDFDYELKTQTAQVHCGSTNTRIKGIDANDFPYKDSDNFEKLAIVSAATLKRMFKIVVPDMPSDDSRQVLVSVHMRMKQNPATNSLTMVTADGHRLALTDTLIESLEKNIEANVNSIGAIAMLKILPDEGEVIIYSDPKSDAMKFSFSNVDLVAGLVSGRYPDFDAIIPKKNQFEAFFERAQLIASIKNARIFARDSADSIRLQINTNMNRKPDEKGVMRVVGEAAIIGKSAERGDTHNLVEVTGTGMTDVSLNGEYILDAIQNMQCDYCVMQQNGADTPVVLIPANAGETVINEIHVIMPMSK